MKKFTEGYKATTEMQWETHTSQSVKPVFFALYYILWRWLVRLWVRGWMLMDFTRAQDLERWTRSRRSF